MPRLNPSLANQQPNPMFRLGALVYGRDDVRRLDFGEPDFPTPAHIRAAAASSITDERQGYGPSNGLAELRAAVAERVSRINEFAPTAGQVVMTEGGTGGLMGSLLTLCAPGDVVLTPDPGWPGYDAMLAVAGVGRAYYPLVAERGWQPDLDALEAAITPQTRVLLVNSPSNPGGAVYPPETVTALVEIAARHDLWLLSDECYDELVYEGAHVSPATLDTDGRVLTVGSFSKTYAMTGWRIGWVVAPPAVAPTLGLVTAAQINNLPLFVQRAALAALSGPQECVAEMRASYRARRDLATDLLRERGLLEYTPAGAFYLLVPVARAAGYGADEPFDALAFAEALLSERKILVAPGSAFGSHATRYARVSLASALDTLRAGITGLLDFAAGWRASSAANSAQ
ncbi:MAG TPA: aminotransferase class I/II-fold pyridoxal phosphate-dependent enzyme [Ktedonobacterales bacterium]|nr:aminotransferase class I/II-fold pyridoxal phosphate-dependent enzyme [Ktedonobacterales bacterium]